ncbi:GAF domain-containing protein [Chryseolinea soli]|uniref:HAMP domain-containing protein n=1 Tax=Chryseolinea soli TaxID=2321403 RepID=A0A385SQ00_9BACT|nr:GAF domain-containing protein [Chryseolinea soli]AYB32035.1 HAMP domain-containing protein [Chryseolinea soli]
MVKWKLNLSRQVSLGYLLIVLVALATSLFCFFTLRNNQKLDDRIRQIYLPTYLLQRDLYALQGDALKLSNSWIYQPDQQGKQQLQAIHTTEFPALKQGLEELLAASGDNSNDMQELLKEFEMVLSAQRELMHVLSADSVYENDFSVDKAIALLDADIKPKTKLLAGHLHAYMQAQERKMNQAQEDKENSYRFLALLLGTMVLLFICISYVAYYFSRKKILKPILRLKDTVLQMSEGKSIEEKFEIEEDEIGEMSHAIATLMKGINARAAFALQIGNGNYTCDFTLLSSEDTMGKALLDMRENLKHNAEEEQRRNWAVSGLAKFAEIIRNQTEFQKLGDAIISNIVKYTKSNQGGLFVISDEDKSDVHLRLLSCYAWDKKKHVEKTIREGQGLVGQCWVEGTSIFMTQVPHDYVTITSGLGYATPRCLVLTPLKLNDAVYGVLELASFQPYQKYELEFIEKVCETIASAISTVKIAQQTASLLKQSQLQTEVMRSQEEEMRQNMEELQTTQEEMERMMKESKGQELYMRNLIDASTDSILTFDHEYKIIHFNQVARAGYRAMDIDLGKTGTNLLQLIPAEEREMFKQLFDAGLSGEAVEITYQTQLETHFIVKHIPIKNEQGKVTAVAQFSTDVTRLMQAQEETKKMLRGSQAQAEELRAQEEELRSTMEAEAQRNKDLERAGSQMEAQKQMMLKVIEKLKEKEKEALSQEEELRAQQEELRQNMEELEATLDLEAKRGKEAERANAQLEAQKLMMIKHIEKFKQKELKSQEQAEELRTQEEELRATVEAEAERIKVLERTNSQAEAQKQMMIESLEKLKKRENELLTELELKEKAIANLRTISDN